MMAANLRLQGSLSAIIQRNGNRKSVRVIFGFRTCNHCFVVILDRSRSKEERKAAILEEYREIFGRVAVPDPV